MQDEKIKKYESALNLLFYEGQIGWQMNIVFLAINGGIIALIVQSLISPDKIMLNILGIILSVGGVIISNKWLYTFKRNSKYYHFRMAQARDAEPDGWNLVGESGFRFSKGNLIEIKKGIPDLIEYHHDIGHQLEPKEEKAKNKDAMELVIRSSIFLYVIIALFLVGYDIFKIFNIKLSMEWSNLLSGLIPSLFTVIITSLILLWAYKKQFKLFEEQIREQRRQINSELVINKNQNSMTMLLKLDKDFNSGDLANARTNVAQKIQRNPSLLQKDKIDYKKDITKDLEDIFDFFDTLSYFIEREYIYAEDSWHFFDYWFSKYYFFYTKYKVKEVSEMESSVWNGLDKLKIYFDKIELAKGGAEQRADCTIEELLDFFKDEMLIDRKN